MELDKDLRSRQEVRVLAEEAQKAFQVLGSMEQKASGLDLRQ